MKISVLIPVYKEPELLGDIISKLLYYDYEDKEVIIVVDGFTSKEIEEELNKFRDIPFVKVIYNKSRLGKVESLNRAVDLCSGEGILFLDNDVELPYYRNFLKKLTEELKRNDIVEMPKEGITTNFFSKIVSYDYLGGAVASILSSRVFGKNLFLCGSAFAIRKDTFLELGKFPKVINEDWSLILKTFGTDKKFSYPIDLKVKTALPKNLREWVQQRKRWAIGMKIWWIELFRKIYLYFRGLPVLAIIGAVMGIPLILSLFLSFIISNSNLSFRVVNISILILQHIFPTVSIPLLSYIVTLLLIGMKGILSLITMVLANTLLFFAFSKILKFRFNIMEFLLYTLLYYPFLVLFYVIYGGIISAFDKSKIDWVVQPEKIF